MSTFANLPRYLVPAWLSTGEAGLKLRTWGETLDANVLRLREGVTRRFPGYAAAAGDDVALGLTGAMRAIPRGRSELAAHYAGRLRAWRGAAGHQIRGGAFGLIGQILEYFGRPVGSSVHTHDVNQTEYYETYAGVRHVYHDMAWQWGLMPFTWWSRFWVVLSAPTLFTETEEFGEDALWAGASDSIGIGGLSPDDANAMRALVHGAHPWRPAGTQPEWIVVALNPSYYDADEYYDTWSRDVAGTRTPVRRANCRYISYAPAHNNTYDGDTDVFSTVVPLPGATMICNGEPPSTPVGVSDLSGEGAAGGLWLAIDAGGEHFIWSTDLVTGTVHVAIAPVVDMASATPPLPGVFLRFATGVFVAGDQYEISATYVGDPGWFPDATVLPSDETYAGDPASFPLNSRLVDDGDPP
jgi:hypothetical protein